MITEADGCSASSSNSWRLGSTRWTRAKVTPSSERMVRPSSPSRARWRLSCWTKSVWPSALGVVEDLVADRAGGRQALGRQHQPGRGDLVARHHDGRAVALDLVLDAGLVERLGDRAGFLQVEVGIEQGFGLAADTQHQRDQRRGDARRDAEDRRQPADPEALQDRVRMAPSRRPSRDTAGRDAPFARQDLPSAW